MAVEQPDNDLPPSPSPPPSLQVQLGIQPAPLLPDPQLQTSSPDPQLPNSSAPLPPASLENAPVSPAPQPVLPRSRARPRPVYYGKPPTLEEGDESDEKTNSSLPPTGHRRAVSLQRPMYPPPKPPVKTQTTNAVDSQPLDLDLDLAAVAAGLDLTVDAHRELALDDLELYASARSRGNTTANTTAAPSSGSSQQQKDLAAQEESYQRLLALSKSQDFNDLDKMDFLYPSGVKLANLLFKVSRCGFAWQASCCFN